MAEKVKLVEMLVGCPECAGRGFVAKSHITNKRNKKPCPVCKGEGEFLKMCEVKY